MLEGGIEIRIMLWFLLLVVYGAGFWYVRKKVDRSFEQGKALQLAALWPFLIFTPRFRQNLLR
jgi:hypothetical protein